MHIKDLPKISGTIKKDGRVEYVVLPFENFKKLIQKAEIGGKIDEKAYMAKYPDVARAIAQKKVKSATEHYLNTGYAESREASVV